MGFEQCRRYLSQAKNGELGEFEVVFLSGASSGMVGWTPPKIIGVVVLDSLVREKNGLICGRAISFLGRSCPHKPL